MSASDFHTLQDLANYIDGRVEGDANCLIYRLATLSDAQKDAVAFYTNNRYKDELSQTKAGCVLLSEQAQSLFDGNKIIVSDPYLAYAKLTALFQEQYHHVPSVHATATIADDVTLGNNVTIGPNVVIDSGTSIADDCCIGANSYIGPKTHIGAGTVLFANVTVYRDAIIGAGCILHSSSVIGADGFGFAPEKPGWRKIYQLGGVVIGSHVEIGASTTIDCGALGDTVIGNGVKIDNQVQIAHNVCIGEHTAIAASTAIAGSAIIGKRCTIAGGVGIVGHIEITDDVHITAMTMVTKSIATPGSYSSGLPMNDTKQWKKNAVRFNQLNEMAIELKSIKKTMQK